MLRDTMKLVWGPPMPGLDDAASIVTILTALSAATLFLIRAFRSKRRSKVTSSPSGSLDTPLNWESRLDDEDLISAAKRGDLESFGLIALQTDVTLEVAKRDSLGRRAVKLTNYSRFLNGSAKPVARVKRRAWFENIDNDGILVLSDDVSVSTEPGTRDHTNFSLLIDPPLSRGAVCDITYVCKGGNFIEDHYWEQSVPVFTKCLQVTLLVDGGRVDISKFAIRDRTGVLQDQSTWTRSGSAVSAEAYSLWPGQEVFLEWSIHESAGGVSHESFSE